jgi:hypothetical protein
MGDTTDFNGNTRSSLFQLLTPTFVVATQAHDTVVTTAASYGLVLFPELLYCNRDWLYSRLLARTAYAHIRKLPVNDPLEINALLNTSHDSFTQGMFRPYSRSGIQEQPQVPYNQDRLPVFT